MEKLKFNGGSFKIMQIADVQENYPLNEDTLKLIELSVEKEKPDLVIFTGDQISGYSACYKNDCETKVKSAINGFLAPLVKRNIPFTFTFGNHDDDCKMSKAAQADYYESFPNCIMGQNRCVQDRGTHFLTLKDSKGEKDIYALYIIDSNKKEADGSYSPVKEEQLTWLQKAREENGYLPALAFQHIPVPEYYNLLKKVSFFTKGRVEAYKSRKNTFYILPGSEGFMGETPAVPEINSGEFDVLKSHGDILGLFVGHDHNNSFVRNLEGIDLGYTQGAGFNTYGPGKKRGVRVFVLNENDLKNYQTYTVTIDELCNYKPSKPFQEFVFSKAPTCVDQVKTDLKRGAVLGGALAATMLIIKKLLK